MLLLGRRLSRHHKLLIGFLVLLVVIVEICLVYYLVFPSDQTGKKSLISGELPPAVFTYHRFNPFPYVYKIKQEIAGSSEIDTNEESPAKGVSVKWQNSFQGNEKSNRDDIPENVGEPVASSNNPTTTKNPPTSIPHNQQQDDEQQHQGHQQQQQQEQKQQQQQQELQAQEQEQQQQQQQQQQQLQEQHKAEGEGRHPVGVAGEQGLTDVRNTSSGHIKSHRGEFRKQEGGHPQIKHKNNEIFVDPHKPFQQNQAAIKPANFCDTYENTGFHIDNFCLKDVVNLTQQYFRKAKYGWCYVRGAELIDKRHECYCMPGWYGQHCSKPAAVEKSNYPYEYGVGITQIPKRVIYAFPFNFEFELLEARIEEFGDLVDVYVILESNYTAAGKAKPRYLLQNLQKGYLKKFQHKILHITMDFFPKAAYKNGWVVDETIRHYLGNQALNRIQNLRFDDVFIIADADELPVWETVFFLKFHYGYPEPVGFNLRHNVFGFYWQGDDLTSPVFGACSIAMLKAVFQGNPYHLRSAGHFMHKNADLVNNYKYKLGGRIHEWSFGTKDAPIGWHCSWCFEPQRIEYKMLSAHLGDLPRWGNDPRKTDLQYIRNAVKNGLWFDDKTKLLPVNNTHDRWFAPKYFKTNMKESAKFLFKPS